jgi:hypothetical protein
LSQPRGGLNAIAPGLLRHHRGGGVNNVLYLSGQYGDSGERKKKKACRSHDHHQDTGASSTVVVVSIEYSKLTRIYSLCYLGYTVSLTCYLFLMVSPSPSNRSTSVAEIMVAVCVPANTYLKEGYPGAWADLPLDARTNIFPCTAS